MTTEKIAGIVNSISGPREHNGKLQVGFTLKENPNVWYNIQGEENDLENIKKVVLSKGNKIEFNFDSLGREIKNLIMTEKAKSDEIINAKVVNIKGKDFVTYAGLLDQAHQKGLISIEIIDSWVSEDMNRAWCKVRAKFKNKTKEMFFDGFGSSTPENTGDMTKTHPVEMAHTRAKGRALRDFLNIGTAMLEELKQESK